MPPQIFNNQPLLDPSGQPAIDPDCCCEGCCCDEALGCTPTSGDTRITYDGPCDWVGNDFDNINPTTIPPGKCVFYEAVGLPGFNCDPPISTATFFDLEAFLYCIDPGGACDYVLEVICHADQGLPDVTTFPALLEVDCENGHLWFAGLTCGCCTLTSIRVNLCADSDPGPAPGTKTLCP
jgi:hypothetical protein